MNIQTTLTQSYILLICAGIVLIILSGCRSEISTAHEEESAKKYEELIEAFRNKPPDLHPQMFASFFPNMESGAYDKSLALETFRKVNHVTPRTTEDNWLRAVRPEGLGMIDYQYLGTSKKGWNAYLVRNNAGGTLTEVAVFFVTFDGETLYRKAAFYPENIRDHSLRVYGDVLQYGKKKMNIDSLANLDQ